MRRNKRSRVTAGRLAGGSVAVAACAVAAAAPPAGLPDTPLGGRLSHLCRAGLWVMGTGHVATGGLLMWLGC